MENNETIGCVGRIVTAEIESANDQSVILKFDGKRACVQRKLWSGSTDIGTPCRIYLESEDSNGMYRASIDKVLPVLLWEKLSLAFRGKEKIRVRIVAADRDGLICDAASVMARLPYGETMISPHDAPQNIGKDLDVWMTSFLDTKGEIRLSQFAPQAGQKQKLKKAFEAQLAKDQTYDATVVGIKEYGVFADIGCGVTGLIHRGDLTWENEMPDKAVKIGDRFRVVVLSNEDKRLRLGRKQLLEDTWAKTAQNLHAGDSVEGDVCALMKFGAFVKMTNGLEGLILNRELSWDDNEVSAEAVLKMGDHVRAVVLAVEQPRHRILLSLKRAQRDEPWEKAKSAYGVGDRVKAPIMNIVEIGIFIDLNNGMRGFIRKTDALRDGITGDWQSHFKIGDSIESVVLGFDDQHRCIQLGVRQLANIQFDDFVARYRVGQRVPAIIKRLLSFGAIAQIDGLDIDGLIHISEMSQKRVAQVSDVVHEGDKVDVTIIKMDTDKRRVSLSLIAEPFDAAPADENDTLPPESSQTKATLGDLFPERMKRRP